MPADLDDFNFACAHNPAFQHTRHHLQHPSPSLPAHSKMVSLNSAEREREYLIPPLVDLHGAGRRLESRHRRVRRVWGSVSASRRRFAVRKSRQMEAGRQGRRRARAKRRTRRRVEWNSWHIDTTCIDSCTQSFVLYPLEEHVQLSEYHGASGRSSLPTGVAHWPPPPPSASTRLFEAASISIRCAAPSTTHIGLHGEDRYM